MCLLVRSFVACLIVCLCLEASVVDRVIQLNEDTILSYAKEATGQTCTLQVWLAFCVRAGLEENSCRTKRLIMFQQPTTRSLAMRHETGKNWPAQKCGMWRWGISFRLIRSGFPMRLHVFANGGLCEGYVSYCINFNGERTSSSNRSASDEMAHWNMM